MVTTFLPIVGDSRQATLENSLKVLDPARLRKQRVEAMQLYQAITEATGYRNHPAAKMWMGHADLLAHYHNLCLRLVKEQGVNTEAQKIPVWVSLDECEVPWWFGWQALADSHAASLLRKHPFYYSTVLSCPAYARERGYLWPSHLEAKYGRDVCATFPGMSEEDHPEWYAKINPESSQNAHRSREMSVTIADLQAILRSHGIKVPRGKKADLLALVEDDWIIAHLQASKLK